ncbi:MAG: metallophosphoesterase [Fuerstiella sp.]|nr:metallophosphoesterase [Fuerstiella sp.]
MRIGLSRVWTLLTVCIVVTSAGADAQRHPNDRTLVSFYAMGDVPYQPEEDELLPKQIAQLPADAEFVVHVGDIKGGGPPCVEAVYEKVSGMLSKSVAPVFIIPGDNEWNDCTDPVQAWAYWNQYFSRFDRRWNHRFPLFRQIEHEENFSFVRNDVLFVGLNVVGGLVHDAAEWKQRHADGLKWIRQNVAEFGKDVTCLVLFGHANPKAKHDDFFQPLSVEAKVFGKPVLYLHGDGHSWIYDRPFTAKNILRVQVDQGGKAPPLKVIVTDSDAQPFRFDRRNGKPTGAPRAKTE